MLAIFLSQARSPGTLGWTVKSRGYCPTKQVLSSSLKQSTVQEASETPQKECLASRVPGELVKCLPCKRQNWVPSLELTPKAGYCSTCL